MKIITLVENSSIDESKYKSEHGISLFIETDIFKILFDTGQSNLFHQNAKKMSIDITTVDCCVISHGHYDHGGGLSTFINENKKSQIFLKKNAFENHLIKFDNNKEIYIGLENTVLKKNRNRFNFIDEFTEIEPNIFIITKIDHNYAKPIGNKTLMKKTDNSIKEDKFNHELILVIRENDGLVIFTGCSHNGILNMIETVESYFKNETIKAVFGGFHLHNSRTDTMNEEKNDVIQIGESLLKKKFIKNIYTGHCTGKIAFDILKDVMGEKLKPFSTGMNIDI